MNWIMDNLATILISTALLALVLGIILYMRKQKKTKPHACGCGCAACPMAEDCAGKDQAASGEVRQEDRLGD